MEARNILELGAGLSTALWARFANRIQCEGDHGRRGFRSDAVLYRIAKTGCARSTSTFASVHRRDPFVAATSRLLYDAITNRLAECLPGRSQKRSKTSSPRQPQPRMEAVRQSALGSESWTAQSIFIPDSKTIRFPANRTRQTQPQRPIRKGCGVSRTTPARTPSTRPKPGT